MGFARTGDGHDDRGRPQSDVQMLLLLVLNLHLLIFLHDLLSHYC